MSSCRSGVLDSQCPEGVERGRLCSEFSECTHFEYCDLCERVDEKKDNPNMKKRK